ncbi:hypothetical protein YC2023_098834 [Brassica napus]
MRWLSLFRKSRVCCDQQQTYRRILPFLSLREEYVFEKMKTKPKRFDTLPVRSQLRHDCLLGCIRGERKAEASEPQGALYLLYEKYFFVKPVMFTFESFLV